LIATFYFCKALLPVGLLPIYPRWSVDPARAVEFLPWLVALGLGAWLWARRDRAGRHALFGLGFFFINLAPVLGFVAISHLRFTWTMDHLSYVALIGLVGVAVAGADRLLQPGAFGFAATGVALLLAMQSHSYARNYRSEVALWEYTLSRNPHAWLAETNLGSYLLADGRTEEALRLLQASVQENPDFAQARNNLGNGLRQAGRLPEATASYRRAVELRPEGAEFHNNLALALAAAGQRDEAIAELETAVRLKPGFGEARNNLGVYLARAGRTDEATRQFEEAVRADPDNAEAHANWGAMLLAAGRRAVALREIREALRLNPTLINAQKLLDRAQAQRGPKADLAPSP
jgi:tetratricopeptide (TPR) repeat protein